MKRFNDWLWEQEGFSLRADRPYADLGNNERLFEMMVNWLKAAYEIGKQEGNQVLDLLKDIEQ